MTRTTREQAASMAGAHAEGWHTPPDGTPREDCPECEGRPLTSYPRAADLPQWGDVKVGDTVSSRGRHGAGQPIVIGVVVEIDGQQVKVDGADGVRTRTISNLRRVP